MTETDQRTVEALERIAAALEMLAAEPERRREHERTQHAVAVEAISMRQAVEGVHQEVSDEARPATDRVKAAKIITREALERDEGR